MGMFKTAAIAVRTWKRNKIIQDILDTEPCWWESPKLKLTICLMIDDLGRGLFPGLLRKFIRNAKFIGGIGKMATGIAAYAEKLQEPK